MPRKSKISVENKPATDGAAQSADVKATAPESKKKSRTAAGPARKKKPAAPKKPAAKQSTPPTFEPTDDQIRLRAYFLAERRIQLALPGDSNHDWIEARRQLIEEAKGQRSSV